VNEDVNLFTSDYSSAGVAEPSGGTFTETINETKDGKDECLKAVWNGSSPSQLFKINFLPIEQGVTFDISAEFYLEGFTGVRMGANGNLGSLNSTTNNWETYTQTITVNNTNDNFVVSLSGGTSGSTIWLKNIVITQTTADGLVSAWYDQSLSNDATQSTAANQPKIVSGGSLVTENGKPAILPVDRTNHFVINPLTLASNTWVFSTIKNPLLQTTAFIEGDNANDFILVTSATSTSTLINSGYSSISFYKDGTAFNPTTRQDAYNGLTSQSLFTASFDGSISTFFNIGYPSSAQIGMFQMQEFVLYLSDQSANRTGIETNINTFYVVYPDFSVSGLLHDYPNAAAAYSVRQLTIYNNGYKEKLIRIRRSSGGETDVFADDSYELSLNSRVSAGGTLGNWIGSDDGFVVTWYDQSTNGNDATQGTAANQPKIVSGGSILLLNSKPVINRNNDDSTLQSPFAPNDGAATKTIVFVGNVSPTRGTLIGSSLGGSDYVLFSQDGSSSTAVNNNATLSNEYINGSPWSYTTRNDVYDELVNQKLVFANVQFSFGVNDMCLGYQGGVSGNTRMMNYQELIIWDSDEVANITGIQNNVNTFYSVYP